MTPPPHYHHQPNSMGERVLSFCRAFSSKGTGCLIRVNSRKWIVKCWISFWRCPLGIWNRIMVGTLSMIIIQNKLVSSEISSRLECKSFHRILMGIKLKTYMGCIEKICKSKVSKVICTVQRLCTWIALKYSWSCFC